MKRMKRVGLILALVLVAIQLVRPAKTNPAIQEDKTLQGALEVRPEVIAIINRSCNDCHSFKTAWPWYGEIAPISWYLIHDVNEGRKELNFSEWSNYNAKRAARKLDRICQEVQKGEMPPKSYVLFHPATRLSRPEQELLCHWTKETRARLVLQLNPDSAVQHDAKSAMPTFRSEDNRSVALRGTWTSLLSVQSLR